MKELPKIYEPQKHEDLIYQKWEQSGFFNPDRAKRGKTFSIVLPPPNVTGQLHIGHATMLSYQDILARFHRLKGEKALWLPGMDHAAIATQNVVEKELRKEGKTRHDLGREKFLERVGEFAEKSKVIIRNQLKKMGSSLDWSREKFTLDEGLSLAVKTAFKRMYDDGLIYRGERVVNWCPRCQSTLADDEVEYEETEGKLYFIKYGPLTIATTRPETKLGDTGVAVNSQDKRYQKLVGQTLNVDLAGHKIQVKVFADREVAMNFGTGAIGVTPAHSQTDFAWAEKYNLPVIKIIDEQGKMTQAAGKYQGLRTNGCREQLVRDLQKAGLIEKVEDYTHNLSVCYRCHTAVEPLTSKQWFVAVNKKIPWRFKTLKQLAVAAVKKGEIKIIPERFNKTYFQWMDNLRDWCISRQIWYGHRIPVWYKNPDKKMGFYEKVVPQIYQGKTKTYRLRDQQFKIGDEVAFESSQTGEIFGQGRIINIEKTTVGQINLQDKAHGATYQNVEELIKAFKKHHPDKEVTVKTPVIIYEYKFSRNSKNDSNIYIGVEPPKGDGSPRFAGEADWIQDEGTLDTWFSSALWTFSTLGWPKKTKDLKDFHPTSVMETGYDILFFWVARMILMSEYLLREKPFAAVYLHGLVRTKSGEKMSKSKPETCIDPLAMIQKYGADALRLSMIIGATPGNDIRLYEEKIAGYRNFVNKLWNISRYILTKIQDTNFPPAIGFASGEWRAGKIQKNHKSQITNHKFTRRSLGVGGTLADQWILSELDKIIISTTKNIEEFRFSQAGEELYEFTWSKLADWYLEIAKIEKGASTSSAQSKDEILLYLLEKLLILWHPFCPFVTEVIWEQLHPNNLLMVECWPKVELRIANRESRSFKLIQEIVTAIRNARAERKINLKTVCDCSIVSAKEKLITENQSVIEGLAKVKIKNQVSGFKIHLSEAEITLAIDENEGLAKNRLKEIENLEYYVKLQEIKLKNKEFIKKAPPAVVEQERAKLEQAQAKLLKLK